jgi:hypothetical protein
MPDGASHRLKLEALNDLTADKPAHVHEKHTRLPVSFTCRHAKRSHALSTQERYGHLRTLVQQEVVASVLHVEAAADYSSYLRSVKRERENIRIWVRKRHIRYVLSYSKSRVSRNVTVCVATRNTTSLAAGDAGATCE